MNLQPGDRTAPSSSISPTEITQRMERGETFVVNLSCAWCHDCKDQGPHLGTFESALSEGGVNFFRIEVQQEYQIFLTPEHQSLSELLGASVQKEVGRLRFPLTVLVVGGEVRGAEYEITTPEGLANLADRFNTKISQSS